ncbi:MAG TPA: BON domain-containing protein [Steroidobacteraceae bacterium]
MRGLGFATAMVAAVPLLAGCVAAVIANSPHSGTAADTRGRSAPGAPTAGADAALAGRLRSRFAADPVLRSELIDVSALAGTVTLSGVVTSSAARSSAERLVRTVVGVRTVNNLLKVQ